MREIARPRLPHCSSFFVANQRQFSDAVARRDLTRYRSRGPDQTTRLLRDAILGAGNGKTVLDVGAGFGALSFELLAAGAERVTAVEAAPAYLAAAREEARRRNVADRIDLVHGDFLSVAVTMDRREELRCLAAQPFFLQLHRLAPAGTMPAA